MLNPNQTRERVIERVNAWPEWKRTFFSYRPPTSETVKIKEDN